MQEFAEEARRNKPKTRIEKLGELYDAAVKNVEKRLTNTDVPADPNLEVSRQDWDMQVITTYLDQTKRPEQQFDPQPLMDAISEMTTMVEGVMALAEREGIEPISESDLKEFRNWMKSDAARRV